MKDEAGAEPKPVSREDQRAAALRANLLRRKAQARGRLDPVVDVSADPDAPSKTPGDA